MDSYIPQSTDRLAYFGRVSTPKQKLVQQWEAVERWLDRQGLNIPENRRFEDKIRRHEAASVIRDWEKRKKKSARKRFRFDDLMELVEAKAIDWIMIATFDRWGISDKDEIFIFRSKLREYDVQLYSVYDELNITSAEDGTFWRVAGAAEGATRYVSSLAEKKIQKMIWMAEHGWAATGNAPFGLDLVCYPIHDLTKPLFRVVRLLYKPHLYKILWYTSDSRIERDENGFIVKTSLHVAREETAPNMPPRDKKATGYRYEPTIEEKRLKAVKMMYEMYDLGIGFAEISESLWKQGCAHYDKPFGYHGVETILGNSAYIGRPAWGKLGVGEYRICINKEPKQVKRKSTDTLTMKKTEDQYIYPNRPLFLPIVPLDLDKRVKDRLKEREHVNPSFGKRRTRAKATHPLNGKLFCPDCDAPMVLGSFMPGGKSHGKKFRCFHCGTWRKTIRTKCHANTVRWELLDKATEELLKIVSDRIDAVKTGIFSQADEIEWLHRTELGKLLIWIRWAAEGKCSLNGPSSEDRHNSTPDDDPDGTAMALKYVTAEIERLEASGIQNTNPEKYKAAIFSLLAGEQSDFLERTETTDIVSQYEAIFAAYDKRFQTDTTALRAEVDALNKELDDIAFELPKQRSKPGIYDRLNKRASEIEKRKAEIEPKLVPLTGRARAMIDQLSAIKDTIQAADQAKMGRLLDSFLERVYPVFEVKGGKEKRRRTLVTGFRFVPRESAKAVLSEVMEIGASHTDRDSSPPAS